MIHDLPRTTDGDTDGRSLREWLSDADVVFSIGKEVEAEIFSSLKLLEPDDKPIHKLYIPSCPLELFNVHRANVHGNKVRGTQTITLMTGDRKDVGISGLDFTLAVWSTAEASKYMSLMG